MSETMALWYDVGGEEETSIVETRTVRQIDEDGNEVAPKGRP
jgi:hypothetical protein